MNCRGEKEGDRKREKKYIEIFFLFFLTAVRSVQFRPLAHSFARSLARSFALSLSLSRSRTHTSSECIFVRFPPSTRTFSSFSFSHTPSLSLSLSFFPLLPLLLPPPSPFYCRASRCICQCISGLYAAPIFLFHPFYSSFILPSPAFASSFYSTSPIDRRYRRDFRQSCRSVTERLFCRGSNTILRLDARRPRVLFARVNDPAVCHSFGKSWAPPSAIAPLSFSRHTPCRFGFNPFATEGAALLSSLVRCSLARSLSYENLLRLAPKISSVCMCTVYALMI